MENIPTIYVIFFKLTNSRYIWFLHDAVKAAFRPPRKFVALDLENMTKAVNEENIPPHPCGIMLGETQV